MAYIRKERGFRSTDLGQGFRALTFRFVSPRVAERGGNLTGEQTDKAAVGKIVAAIWIDACDEEPRRPLLPLILKGHNGDVFGRPVPIARRQVSGPALPGQILDQQRNRILKDLMR